MATVMTPTVFRPVSRTFPDAKKVRKEWHYLNTPGGNLCNKLNRCRRLRYKLLNESLHCAGYTKALYFFSTVDLLKLEDRLLADIEYRRLVRKLRRKTFINRFVPLCALLMMIAFAAFLVR